MPESLETVIITAVHRLPSAVREFVYFNCQFALSDEGAVRMHQIPQARQRWLIRLGEGYVDESVVIQGIAHAWLGHEYDPHREELQVNQRDEQAACDLIRQWGLHRGLRALLAALSIPLALAVQKRSVGNSRMVQLLPIAKCLPNREVRHIQTKALASFGPIS